MLALLRNERWAAEFCSAEAALLEAFPIAVVNIICHPKHLSLK